MDFVTIVFNDAIEIQLLKLQAFSFQLVDPTLIHRILIVFNDSKDLDSEFTAIFEHVIPYYPPNIRNKVRLVFTKELDLDLPYSDWYTQQVVKIQVSKIVETEYYLVLDGKNHFIKNIQKSMFFNNRGKPYLYVNDAGEIFGNYYNNCMNYFNTSCPNANLGFGRLRIQTITPFLFITNECRDLIHFVETKEQKPFNEFFIQSKMYTEFYFYYSYLTHCNKHNLYEINPVYTPFATVGDQDPQIHKYNSWESIKHVMKTQNIYIFSLHRRCLSILDKDYKQNLIEFYTDVYKNPSIIKKILYFLYMN
jgi:hypothetical protein